MNRMTARSVTNALSRLKSAKKAAVFARYFKTDVGEYGHGDIFIGVMVPEQRKIAKKFKDLPLIDISKLLKSPIHEHRLTALFILTYKPIDKEIYDFFMSHMKYINNWDLVDSSADDIVGKYLFDKNRNILEILAHSENLWERRIAIISTLYFINKKDFSTTITVAKRLLRDHHDLIHKAVGWMLREIGKRDRQVLVDFLKEHGHDMPRTMLRYATEHFSNRERQAIVGR